MGPSYGNQYQGHLSRLQICCAHHAQTKSGCIINMASGAAVLGLAQRAAYTASKGAVYSLTRAMQADYCHSGIP
jgi:NAD(P)-dependent dehydrogenase (short-subunit alcohol dehydrogenase family)